MEAKTALSRNVWKPQKEVLPAKEVLPQKEVLPEDTDQPADAQDPTLYLSAQAKPSTASGSTPPPWASASSAPSASSQPDLSSIMSKFSPNELACLEAYWASQQ